MSAASLLLHSCGVVTSSVELGIIKGPNKGQGSNQHDDVFNSLAISPASSEVIYAGSEGNGMFKSGDGGTTWSWLRSGLYYAKHAGGVSEYPEIYEIIVDQNNANVVYAAAVGSDIGGVYKSLDGGANWHRYSSGIHNLYIDCIAMDPQSSATLYIGLDGAAYSNLAGDILKSTNSGESFAKLGSMPSYTGKSRFEKIKVIDSNKIIAVGINYNNTNESAGLVKTADGGSSWAEISPPGIKPDHFDVSPQNGSLIYAAKNGDNVIYRSTNEGVSWTAVSVPYVCGTIKIFPFDDNVIFFSAGTVLRKSSDGLQTSTVILTYEADCGSSNFAMAFSSYDHDLVYLAKAGYIIYKSRDQGATFTKVANLREYINTH